MQTRRLCLASLRMLGRYRLRSFFMMLGVTVGVAALTLSISIGEGARRKLIGTVERFLGSSALLVLAGDARVLDGVRASSPRLTMEDIEALAAELPNVDTWDPMQSLPPREVRHRERSASLRVVGYSERSEQVWGRGVVAGEYFDAQAVQHAERVALLGQKAVTRLFDDDDPLGRQIWIGSVPFRVGGVLEALGTDPHGMDRDDEVVVPISTLMRRLANLDGILGAKLLLKDPRQMAATAGGVRDVLRRRHVIAPGEPDDFAVITPVEVQRWVARATRVFAVFLPLVAGLALLVGTAVAASLMLVSVNERVAEIGLRRAVGARSVDIRRQFLLETLVVTLVGGLAGVLIGLVAVQALAYRLALEGVIVWGAVAWSVALSGVAGLAAGVLPARRAGALEPIEALR